MVSNRREFKAEAKKWLKGALASFDRGLSNSLRREVEGDTTPASLFIVGGPRSGSTLLYQALVATRKFAFANNFVARLPMSGPYLGRALRMGAWPVHRRFSSRYGDTTGLASPSEAGDLWDLVFPWDRHHSVEPEQFLPENRAHLHAAISQLCLTYDGPFLAKNLWNSVRIEALSAALPQSLFIVIHRDPMLMAQSLLKSRRRGLGDEKGFWSIRPRELLPYKDADPASHTAIQLCMTYEAIERARRALGERRFLDIHYEEFCMDPANVICSVDRFIERHGISIKKKADIETSFRNESSLHLDRQDAEKLQSVFDQRWPYR